MKRTKEVEQNVRLGTQHARLHGIEGRRHSGAIGIRLSGEVGKATRPMKHLRIVVADRKHCD